MRRLRLALGLTTGLVAASATAGALIGFGLRFGTPARPFNTLAAILPGAGAQGEWRFAALSTIVGVLLHVAFTTACGVIYVALVERSGGRAGLWALVVATAAFLVSSATAVLLGAGLATLLPFAERVALGALLAASLFLGMRFALSMWRGEQDVR